MGTAEHERVSTDEFLEWVSGQAGRFELVEGYLVEVRTGATQGHNVVITNIVSSVGLKRRSAGAERQPATRRFRRTQAPSAILMSSLTAAL